MIKQAVPCALYRHFSADGELLYVGVSLSALRRLGEHERNAGWFASIASMTVEQFSTRAEAEQAEIQAIRSERPRHNKTYRAPMPGIGVKGTPMQPDELKALRKAAKWSQGQLDEALGLTPGYVGKMERGDKPIERRTELAVRYLALRPRVEAYQSGIDQAAEQGVPGAASASAALDHVLDMLPEATL